MYSYFNDILLQNIKSENEFRTSGSHIRKLTHRLNAIYGVYISFKADSFALIFVCTTFV